MGHHGSGARGGEGSHMEGAGRGSEGGESEGPSPMHRECIPSPGEKPPAHVQAHHNNSFGDGYVLPIYDLISTKTSASGGLNTEVGQAVPGRGDQILNGGGITTLKTARNEMETVQTVEHPSNEATILRRR